jgi:perosamine synthetase
MKIPLAMPMFDKEMEEAALGALRNERYVLGESVHKFEEEFAKYCGTNYAVSTSSGTDALKIALIASGVEPGQAAITSPASFIASANAIVHAQAQPLFADIDLVTYNASPKHIEKAITAKTKAIVPVHLYGYPADMDPINAIARKRQLIVIEDSCQAHGASYGGKKTGNLGLVGCFSFYTSKNMNVCGDGGMISTNDEKIALQAAKLRDCGRKSQYVHDVIGFTSRLNTVNAAIGRVQLKRLDGWNDSRRKVAQIYNQLLTGVGDLILPPKGNEEILPVYHLYVVRTKYRDELKAWLESQGIGCGVHYALPIHLQPIYQALYGFKDGTFPSSEELCKTCLSIPIFPSISREEIAFICERIRDFYRNKKELAK